MNKEEEKLVPGAIEIRLDSQQDEEKTPPKLDNKLPQIADPKKIIKSTNYPITDPKIGTSKVVSIESASASDEPSGHAASYPEADPKSVAATTSMPKSPVGKNSKIILKSGTKQKERGQGAEMLEAIKARKYTKEYFEKQRKEQIGVTTLVGPRRESSIMKISSAPSAEPSGHVELERQISLDSNEQIPNMDILLNNIEKNTSLKVKLEKAIIEFNQSPAKAFEFLWKEQIVF